MRIKVFTKHWIYTEPPVGWKPPKIAYDFEQSFIFTFANNMLTIQDGSWCNPCNDLEQCFKLIKGYFHGSHYQVFDMLPMTN